jgi:CHAT domain-containing protein
VGRDEPVPSLAAIVNPTGDLPFTPIEAALVEGLFAAEARSALDGDQATADAVLNMLKTKSHWLFSCHGNFDWDDPRQSGLRLAGGEALTLDALLAAHGLGNPRLVALSACETGLSDINRSPEEFIGLPTGFLQLGAAGVLATLWPVNDASAALLVSRFFRYHVADRMPPAEALKSAQLWLRKATVRDLRQYLDDQVAAGRITRKAAEPVRQELLERANFDPNHCLFEHPFHWGGWAYFGA